MTRENALALVLMELKRAEEKYPAFASVDAAYAVLLKQVFDLRGEIKANGDVTHDLPQIAVAAIRGLMALP